MTPYVTGSPNTEAYIPLLQQAASNGSWYLVLKMFLPQTNTVNPRPVLRIRDVFNKCCPAILNIVEEEGLEEKLERPKLLIFKKYFPFKWFSDFNKYKTQNTFTLDLVLALL